MDKKNYKLLIVDDDHPLADLVQMNFSSNQFSTRVCYSGKDALKEIEKERPDIIILDVVMPRMDGWEVLQNIKSNLTSASIPVIMCTSKDSVGDVEKSFYYGAQAYVMKPIDFKKLRQKVASILDVEELLRNG